MSEGTITCTPAEWERIVARFSNPRHPGSPAAAVAACLHDDVRAEELVRQWIEEEALKCLAKGQTVTPALLVRIGRRTSREALLHRASGVSVRLVRAGDAYERRLAARRSADPSPVSRAERETIWDEAVDDHIEGQRRRNGHVSIWLPYHDGASSNPAARRRVSSLGGLDEWEALFSQGVDRFIEDEERERALACADQPRFEATAEWLSEHGVDAASLVAIPRADLAAWGVDPDAVERLCAARPASGPLGALTLAMREPALARALMEANPGVDAARLLARAGGMPTRLAATGLVFERLAEDGLARRDAWDEACARMGAKATHPGDAGWRDWCRGVTDACEWVRGCVEAGHAPAMPAREPAAAR